MKEQQMRLNKELEELEEIEKEIKNVVALDKKNWVRFYLLIKKVKERDLWRVADKNPSRSG